MPRLIDANAIRDKWLYNGLNEKIYDANDFLDSIDEAPTIDAVPVVWCKDCKWRSKLFCPMVHETLGNGTVDYSHDNWYCAFGKRKDVSE